MSLRRICFLNSLIGALIYGMVCTSISFAQTPTPTPVVFSKECRSLYYKRLRASTDVARKTSRYQTAIAVKNSVQNFANQQKVFLNITMNAQRAAFENRTDAKKDNIDAQINRLRDRKDDCFLFCGDFEDSIDYQIERLKNRKKDYDADEEVYKAKLAERYARRVAAIDARVARYQQRILDRQGELQISRAYYDSVLSLYAAAQCPQV